MIWRQQESFLGIFKGILTSYMPLKFILLQLVLLALFLPDRFEKLDTRLSPATALLISADISHYAIYFCTPEQRKKRLNSVSWRACLKPSFSNGALRCVRRCFLEPSNQLQNTFKSSEETPTIFFCKIWANPFCVQLLICSTYM